MSRAVRVGDRVLVAGTAPIWPDGSCDPDPGVQARRCWRSCWRRCARSAPSLATWFRTRMFITDASDGDAVGLAHGEVFADVPAGGDDGGGGRTARPALEGGDRGRRNPRLTIRRVGSVRRLVVITPPAGRRRSPFVAGGVGRGDRSATGGALVRGQGDCQRLQVVLGRRLERAGVAHPSRNRRCNYRTRPAPSSRPRRPLAPVPSSTVVPPDVT